MKIGPGRHILRSIRQTGGGCGLAVIVIGLFRIYPSRVRINILVLMMLSMRVPINSLSISLYNRSMQVPTVSASFHFHSLQQREMHAVRSASSTWWSVPTLKSAEPLTRFGGIGLFAPGTACIVMTSLPHSNLPADQRIDDYRPNVGQYK